MKPLTDDEIWGEPKPFWHYHKCMGCGEVFHCADKHDSGKLLILCGMCFSKLITIKERIKN